MMHRARVVFNSTIALPNTAKTVRPSSTDETGGFALMIARYRTFHGRDRTNS